MWDIEWHDVDWAYLAWDSDNWQAVVKTVMNILNVHHPR
jgi:hypothetical protein